MVKKLGKKSTQILTLLEVLKRYLEDIRYFIDVDPDVAKESIDGLINDLEKEIKKR